MNTLLNLEGVSGKVAIVTGAAGDIGSVIAADLLAAGACVVGVGRQKRSLEACLQKTTTDQGRSLAIRADIRRERDVRRAIRATLRRFGRIDILVNNAGARGPTTPITRLRLRDWQEVMDTNLTGPFLLSRESLKHMARRREGRIVNIASVVGHWAYPLRASYAASKAGLLSLTLTLAQEAGGVNVQVNAVCPGPVAGDAIETVLAARARALGISIEKMREQFMRPAALRRMVTPRDISQTVLFLCSDAARNITGQVIDVSAGYGLYPGM